MHANTASCAPAVTPDFLGTAEDEESVADSETEVLESDDDAASDSDEVSDSLVVSDPEEEEECNADDAAAEAAAATGTTATEAAAVVLRSQSAINADNRKFLQQFIEEHKLKHPLRWNPVLELAQDAKSLQRNSGGYTMKQLKTQIKWLLDPANAQPAVAASEGVFAVTPAAAAHLE